MTKNSFFSIVCLIVLMLIALMFTGCISIPTHEKDGTEKYRKGYHDAIRDSIKVINKAENKDDALYFLKSLSDLSDMWTSETIQEKYEAHQRMEKEQ